MREKAQSRKTYKDRNGRQKTEVRPVAARQENKSDSEGEMHVLGKPHAKNIPKNHGNEIGSSKPAHTRLWSIPADRSMLPVVADQAQNGIACTHDMPCSPIDNTDECKAGTNVEVKR